MKSGKSAISWGCRGLKKQDTCDSLAGALILPSLVSQSCESCCVCVKTSHQASAMINGFENTLYHCIMMD